MAFHKVGRGGEDANDERAIARSLGPGGVDQHIRQALQMIWMMLPPEKRDAQSVEREFRRLSDRALRDLHEDIKAFGLGT